MIRPIKSINQHKIRTLICLDKSIYENSKKKGLNISRLCNALLALYLGKTSNNNLDLGGIEPPVSCMPCRRDTVSLQAR